MGNLVGRNHDGPVDVRAGAEWARSILVARRSDWSCARFPGLSRALCPYAVTASVAVALVVLLNGAVSAGAESPHPASGVAPLTRRDDPALFVTAHTPLTGRQVDDLRRATGASSVVVVDLARVTLGQGETGAVGVDPSTFRAIAPRGAAEADGLWGAIARGDVAVAHAIGRALALSPGGWSRAGRGARRAVRIGAFATMQLPGVGLVVDRALSGDLGLVRSTGAAVVVPGGPDPVVLAAKARQAIPGVEVSSLRRIVIDGSPSLRPVAGRSRLHPRGHPRTRSAGVASPRPGTPPTLVRPAAAVRTGGPRTSARPHRSRRPQPSRPAAWVRPADGPVTQGFGPSSPGGRHPGIDIGAPLGSPVRAAADGQVLYAGPAQGFGNEIILQHAGGVQTIYGHMRVLLVRAGLVSEGQVIALVGSEGQSTGPHLHFEVHVNNRLIDPAAWLSDHGVRIREP